MTEFHADHAPKVSISENLANAGDARTAFGPTRL